jgi:hypothetical protein
VDQQTIIPLEPSSPPIGEALTAPRSNGKQVVPEGDHIDPSPNGAATVLAQLSDQVVEEALAEGSRLLQDHVQAALADLRQEVADGLLYTHGRANSNTSRLLEARRLGRRMRPNPSKRRRLT